MNPYFDTLADQKLAYLVLKKCGCTSIMAAFKKYRGDEFNATSPKSVHGNVSTTLKPEHLDGGAGWYTFTIVRDPIRRFLSFYSDKVLSRTFRGNRVAENADRFGYRSNMGLDEAIDVTVAGKHEPETHAIVQSELIDAVGFDLNYIGRFEDFEESIARVATETGVDLAVLHLNRRLRSPILLTKHQFEKLSRHYEPDQRRFGYPTDYVRWCEINVDPRSERFQTEQGFVFENEAKLLRHRITRLDDRFTIELSWQVHARHSRTRYIRLLERLDNEQTVLMRLPDAKSLASICDEQGIANEVLQLKFSEIPPHRFPERLCLDIYFWDRDRKKAELVNFNEGTRLVLPLPVA
jgi:hypothetical protein